MNNCVCGKGGGIIDSKGKNPVKTVGIMMAITLVGKVLGLVRDRLMTINYGTGVQANAFLTASRIPRVFFDTVFASAIAASFIPVFAEILQKKGKKEAIDFSGNFITVISVLCLILTALGMAFAGGLVTLFADGYDAQTAELCVMLTRIMFPTVLFTGIAYSFVGILQSLDEFNIPALISLVSNLVIIAYYVFLNDRFGIKGLAIAFLIAWLLQALIQIPSLIKKGFRYRPGFSFRSPGMKKVFALMLPVMVSTWVLPINQTINSKFASRLFSGSGVSAMELSFNLYTVIAGVFVLSVTNFVFPRMSRQSADDDKAQLNKTLRSTMHTSMYIVLPMMAGLMCIAKPLISFIYGGGMFDMFSVNITSRALIFMSLGMVGYAAQAILCRVYFAGQEGKVPLIAGAISVAVNIVLCLILTKPFNVAGLGIASAVSSTVNAVALAIPLKKRGAKFWDALFGADMLKILLAAAVMAAAVTGVSALAGRAGTITVIVLSAAVGAVLYFAMTVLLKVPESGMVTGFIKRKLRRNADARDI